MLAYVDQSGDAVPNDPCKRPMLAAVCIRREDHRQIQSRIFKLKKDLYPFYDPWKIEIKAHNLLKDGTFSRAERGGGALRAAKFVEGVFKNCIQAHNELKIFAVVMHRPDFRPYQEPGFLPRQTVFLLQRVNRFMETFHEDRMATVVFDEKDLGADRKLATSFSRFLFTSNEGKAFKHILPTPLFVDSQPTTGLQVADLVAGVIRHYEENNLETIQFPTEPFLLHLKFYFDIVKQRSHDFRNRDGHTELFGIYKMPVHFFPSGPAGG